MSCFGGRMKEYERISLDRFDGKNLQSTVYFLSHLHEDHTVGLATPVFFKHLKSSKNVFLYCSDVTEVLIEASKKYRHLAPYIKKIGINTPTTIEIPDPLYDEVETVTVTFLPAFHCPGSVMCLFEGHEGTVLYTGDFRWEHFNIEQMYHLRSGESVKKVKSLYVDTTFCTPENLYIPSRQHCIDAVYQLVYEWVSQSPQHVVYLSLRAQYGHEPLLNAVASRLNRKIHVAQHKVEVYNQIEEFHGNFTDDGSSTQIHACGREMQNIDGENIPCRHTHDPDKVLGILPTTMYFTQFQHLTLDKIVRKVGDGFYRVCYSFHSSYTELKDLISYLKPENVYPNVKPPNDSSLAVVQYRLNTMLAECMSSSNCAGDTEADTEVKQLGTLKTRSSKRTTGKRKPSTPSESDSLDFGTPSKLQKTDTKPQRQTRGRGRNSGVKSSQESETEVTPAKGRGIGRGRQPRSSQEVAEEPQKRVSTRLRSKKVPEKNLPQEKTPVKKQDESPDIFLTPSKSEHSDVSKHSSYSGSHGDESEIDLSLSQKSLELESSLEAKGDNIETWTGGSFLSAVSSHSGDEMENCVCLVEDVEQTDENFEDVSQIEEEMGDEGGLTLEDVEEMETAGDVTQANSSPKKTMARKGRKSRGKVASKSNRSRKQDNNKSVCSEMSEGSTENIQKCETDTVVVNISEHMLSESSEKSENTVTAKQTKEHETTSKNKQKDINEPKSAKALNIDQNQDIHVKQQTREKGTKTVSRPVNKTSKQESKKVSEPVTNRSKQEGKILSEPVIDTSKQESKTISEPVTSTSKQKSKTKTEPVTNTAKNDSKTVSETVTDVLKQDCRIVVEPTTNTSKQEGKSVSKTVIDTSEQENRNSLNVDVDRDSQCDSETAVGKPEQQLTSKQVDQKCSERACQNAKEDKSIKMETENKNSSKEGPTQTKDFENNTSTKSKTDKENETFTCILENKDLSSNGKDSEIDSHKELQKKKTTESGKEQTKTCVEVARTCNSEAAPETSDVATSKASHLSDSERPKEDQISKKVPVKPKKDESSPDKVIPEVAMETNDTSEEATETSDKCEIKVSIIGNVGGAEGAADVVDDQCDEDISSAIAESMGADLEFCEDDDIEAWKDQFFVCDDDPSLEEDKYNDTENELNDAGSNVSDDSDIIRDTPPLQITVIETQFDKSLSSSVTGDQTPSSEKLFYTRHWPLTGSGTKQERRRKRKRKQRKKKYAALHGIIYYDSDCEIVIADEPKVEIDLTVGKSYDENDFEYDMRKRRKRAKRMSDTSNNDTLITVFKEEKLDDYHLYGGVKVHHTYQEEKSVKKLKYTRRSSFEFGEENPEDVEFVAELEEALTKKDSSQSDTVLESKLQPVTDPLYEGLMEAEPLQKESEKSMEEADLKDSNDFNTGKDNEQTLEKNSVELADNEIEIKSSDKNDKGKELQKPENNIMVGNETVKINETDKSKQNEESSKPHKTSQIQYTETKEGKKLMRISLSGKKKTRLMPRQNYLGTEIFIDLSNEDETNEVSENKSYPVSEKLESITPSSSKQSDGDKTDSQVELDTNMIPVKGVTKESISEQKDSNDSSRIQGNDADAITSTVEQKKETVNQSQILAQESSENKNHPLSSEHARNDGRTILKFNKVEGKFTRRKVTDSERYDNSEKTKIVGEQPGKSSSDLSETSVNDFNDTECTEVVSDESQKNEVDINSLDHPEKAEICVLDVQNAADGKENDCFGKGNIRKDNALKRCEVVEMGNTENSLEREESFDAEIVDTNDKFEDNLNKDNHIPGLSEDEIEIVDSTEKLEDSVNKDNHIPGLSDDEIEIVETNNKLDDSMNTDNYIPGLNEKEADVLCVTDDENSRGSTDSGEWLSCSKAMEKQQQHIKRGKGRKKRLPKSDMQSKIKPQRLEKEPVKHVIDKYVKHISSAEKQKAKVPVFNENKAEMVKHSQSATLYQDEKKKQEKIKRKALEIMFGTDDEKESETERKKDVSPTQDIYDETISLSSDSELDEELFKKNDSEMEKTPDSGRTSKDRLSVGESTTLTSKDRLPDSDSTAVEADQQENQRKLPFGISSLVKNIDWASDISHKDTQASDGPNITDVACDNSQAQDGQSIKVVNHKKTKKKKKSRFGTQTVSTVGSSGSFSNLQTNVTQPNSPFFPGSRTVPPVASIVSPPVLYPSSFYKVPPPVYNAPPTVYNMPPPNFNLPPPVSVIPQPNINYPPPPLPSASSVTNSSVVNTVPSQSILSAVPSSDSSQTLFSSLRSQAASDSFLASLPGTDPSQSLLSSVSLPSTVVGTLNKVLDVILNSKASGVLDKETTTTKSSADTQSVVTEVIDKVNKIQASRTSFGQREDRHANSEVIIEDYGHRTSHRQDKRGKSDDQRQRHDDLSDKRGRLDDKRHRYDDDMRERESADGQRYRPDDGLDERERADHRYRQIRVRDERERADDLRYRRDDMRAHRDRADDLRYRHDEMSERHTGRRYSHDDPRYDPDPRRYEDSERYRRMESDRPISPGDPYERERAREYDRERAWADYYRQRDEDERRRYDYDRHHYEDDYDRSRRPRDPHYDYSPPRYSDRPHDPYYDDRRRHSRDPYRDYPPEDPYNDPPPRRYEDRYDESQTRLHSRGSGSLSDHSDFDHRRPTSPTQQWDEPKQPGRPRQPGKPPLVQGRQSKIPSLFDHPVKEPSSLDQSKGSASRNFPSAQSRNIPQHSQSYSQNTQASSSQQGVSRLAQYANFSQPSLPKKAILVSRGKRVGMASQEMMEKAQAGVSSKDITAANPHTGNVDSSRPAFCTGLSQESIQKTGYRYRSSLREKIKSLLNESDKT